MKNTLRTYFALVLLISIVSSKQQERQKEVKKYIESLDLKKIKKGVFIRETYKSINTICINDGIENQMVLKRPVSLAYYLITSEAKDHYHKLNSDEIWTYHAGEYVKITMIYQDGSYHEVILDSSNPHCVVPANTWYYAATDDFVFASLVVAPGFQPQDYEDGDIESLKQQFPQHIDILSQGFK